MKKTMEFDDQSINVTDIICPGPVQIVVVGTGPSDITSERILDDLSQPLPFGQYNPEIRYRAGSDNCNARNDNCNAGRCNRNAQQQQQNGRPTNRGREPIWGDQESGRLPPLRLVFRDSSLAQSSQQQMPSRIPVPCPCRPEQPRRQDRPVDLYAGSRLPVPNRPGRAPARIPRNDRRGTCDVQPPPCADQNSRRGTYTVQPEARVSCAQDNRRGTYDVSQPCAALQCGRRSSCNVQPQPASTPNCRGSGMGTSPTGSFTMTGTIRLDGFQGLSPVRPPPPRNRSSSCSRVQHDTDRAIDAFLENQLNADMVAPRSMAVPGQPYVRIDESAGNTTPEQWRQMMDNRSSIGSPPMGIRSPGYDDYRSSLDTSADSSRLQRGSSCDRQSRPFGMDDSCPMSSSLSPCERPSRARSATPDCGLRNRKNRCRRDTFDRNTR